MHRRSKLVLTLLWFLPTLLSAVERGQIEVHAVDAPSVADNLIGEPEQRRVSVYLPPGYGLDPDQNYPTVYLLHGIMDSDTTWTQAWDSSPPGYGTIQDLMDEGIAAGAFRPMIVVMPDANKTGHYTNSEVIGRWEDFIRKDLIDFVDDRYQTIQNGAARGIAGHSMGGHGAIKMGLKYPSEFRAVYALNPSLLDWAADVSIDNPAFLGLTEVTSLSALGSANFYIQALVGVGQAFSPNPDSTPFLTDFPFRVEGGLVAPSPSAYARWQQQMPLHWLGTERVQPDLLPYLRFDSAFEDEFTHIPITARRFSEALTAHGIDHQFELYNGDHRNRLWGQGGRLYTEVLPYFSRLLHDRPSEPENKHGLNASGLLEQLWDAAIAGDSERLQSAVGSGVDVNALDTRTSKSGRRALNWAAWHDHASIIRELVAAGADVNLANLTGFAPLHHAAESGSQRAADELLRAGADPRSQNRFSHTPAETARRHGHEVLAARLTAAESALHEDP